MSAADPLARAYRRLLRAYPRHYRRVRGLEMLTTLLDSVAPGQRRPSARDVVDIVYGGVAYRFRVPPTLGYRVIAATAAVSVAGLAGWIGALAGWQRGTSLPTRAEVVAAVTVAVPDAAQRMPTGQKTCDWRCDPSDPSDDAVTTYRGPFQSDPIHAQLFDRPRGTDPAVNRVYLPLTTPRDQMPTTAAQAHDRLAAAGWRVSPVRIDGDTQGFWAVKGGLTLRFQGRGTTYPDDPAVAFIVHHDAPAATLPAAVVGAGVGLVCGWWAAAFAIRRFPRHGRPIQTAMLSTGVAALSVAAVTSANALLNTVSHLSNGGPGQAQSVLLGAMLQPLLPLAAMGLLVCLVLAMTPVRRTAEMPAPGPRPDPGPTPA
ncbi:hypothetical protein [Virgisporangium ochraceum]|uniref:Uncharacterized protein n=1 Tax=Virgisporangium ochraceum TaxID=65505 RepID=A0A8J4A163_9ACTN|nr:hypothetical protein [Virgisporangium ochraceum]GIJ72903.1 hypothetical protein Voc01_078200 [Virgisporangium ochraceum]